jgi:hypothetical protein
MYTAPSCSDSHWSLAGVLRAELAGRGYTELPEYGWQGADHAETAWLYALLKTADLLDAEFRRLERSMLSTRAAVKSWSVLREGGLDEGEEEEECAAGLEPGEVPEETAWPSQAQASPLPAGFWDEDRILLKVYAFNEAHALYLFALDFTQPLAADHPREMPFPPRYRMSVVELLDGLMRDERSGLPELTGVVQRMVSMDLGRYRLVPCYDLDLNKEMWHIAMST